MVFAKDRKIFIKTGFTDMRKQINGLSAIAEGTMPEPPLSGAYFVICGKTGRLIKVLYWDQTGFCLWMKRLEEATFTWPPLGPWTTRSCVPTRTWSKTKSDPSS